VNAALGVVDGGGPSARPGLRRTQQI
jgi:hypothetical protein